jgi:hypothetical protein
VCLAVFMVWVLFFVALQRKKRFFGKLDEGFGFLE